MKRWRAAQAKFLAASETSEKWRRWLEQVRGAAAIVASPRDTATLEAAASRSEEALATAVRMDRDSREALDVASRTLTSAEAELAQHASQGPGLFARLFASPEAGDWTRRHNALESAARIARAQLTLANHAAGLLREDLLRKQKESESAKAALAIEEGAVSTAQATLDRARAYGVVVADVAFFQRDHISKHGSSVWFTIAAQAARDDAFRAAIEVHRAFIDAAARPLRHNLGALMAAFGGQGLRGGEKKDALLPHLWTSLFLVVPVISTTFASVGRMLGRLPPASLGWLFADEAGQALPQAAVGALMRCRRAVILGDPMQLEPIVQLPETLVTAICEQMNVDPDVFAAPSASVQTLADRASTLVSTLSAADGERTVGIPLLVHRRCAAPMFQIANRIAYDNQMVHAKESKDSDIHRVLGPSRWIDVEGRAQEKWCPEEGQEVLSLFQTLTENGVHPDLYVLSPFRIVAANLREVILKSGVLAGMISDDARKWTQERIGTVHTAQGREAECIILVLGAPSATQGGARNWAGGRPNLLNVAVTRAKEVLYVIGNRGLWRTAGVFDHLHAGLAQWNNEDPDIQESRPSGTQRPGTSLRWL